MKKMSFKQKFVTFALLAVFAVFGLACQKQSADVNTDGANTASVNAAPPEASSAPVPGMQTPTETYKKLYAAVKSQNIEDIKMVISKQSLSFAQGIGAQQKKPLEEVIKNGFTATTFAETLPEIRDERVKETMGALEVWNEKDKKWDDLPFIYENGGWRLAIGDVFSGKWTKPAKGMAELEANTNQLPPAAPSNGNPFKNSNRVLKPEPPPANPNR